MSPRNPHAGIPFDDTDAAIAAALEDVSIPTLLCSLVHITGDPSWVRGELRPQGLFLNEVGSGRTLRSSIPGTRMPRARSTS